VLSENKTVRIKFSKKGKLKYISHLDLGRTFKVCFKRSGIPIKYTEGFNPHAKMVFALTVSVGSESECEYLDIKITKAMRRDEFVNRLALALPQDIKIIDVYNADTKFADIEYSKYEIEFEHPEYYSSEFIEKFRSGPIMVMKHTKSGEREENIQKGIKMLSWNGNLMTAVLSASQGNYLNPEYLVKGLYAASGKENFCRITRTDVLDKNSRPFK